MTVIENIRSEEKLINFRLFINKSTSFINKKEIFYLQRTLQLNYYFSLLK